MERTFDCVYCGVPVTFEPGMVERACPGCGEAVPLPAVFVPEVPAIEGDAIGTYGRVLARCEKCSVILSATQTVTLCPYCGEPARAVTAAPALREAQGFAPFLVDEARARAELARKLDALGLQTSPALLDAIFVPWWVVDYDIEAAYEGKRGAVVKTSERTKISWVATAGVIERRRENVDCCGSRRIPADAAARLRPWDFAFVEPLRPDGLANALVEHTDLDARGAVELALPDNRAWLEREIKFEIGGDTQRVDTIDAKHESVRTRMILLPLWVGRLEGAGRAFYVNARTGEVLVEGHEHANPEDDHLPSTPPRSVMRLVVTILLVATVLCLVGLMQFLIMVP